MDRDGCRTASCVSWGAANGTGRAPGTAALLLKSSCLKLVSLCVGSKITVVVRWIGVGLLRACHAQQGTGVL